jgi:2'-5' RNA ligase
VYSLNVPVPSRVARLAARIARDCPRARSRGRDEHTLVLKRLGDANQQTYGRLEARVRESLRGQPPFEVRIGSVGYFAEAASGRSPVVYLAVQSRAVESIHDRLVGPFDAATGIEGDEYVPHVTVARGGSLESARRVAAQEIDPISWTVSELVFWDGRHDHPVTTLSLPA